LCPLLLSELAFGPRHLEQCMNVSIAVILQLPNNGP
jgi:hypothetical protein